MPPFRLAYFTEIGPAPFVQPHLEDAVAAHRVVIERHLGLASLYFTCFSSDSAAATTAGVGTTSASWTVP